MMTGLQHSSHTLEKSQYSYIYAFDTKKIGNGLIFFFHIKRSADSHFVQKDLTPST